MSPAYEDVPLFFPPALTLAQAAELCHMAPASFRAAAWRLSQAGRDLHAAGTSRPRLWDRDAVTAWLAEGKPSAPQAPPKILGPVPDEATRLWAAAVAHVEQAHRAREQAAELKARAVALCRAQGLTDAAIGVAFEIPRQRVAQLAGSRSGG